MEAIGVAVSENLTVVIIGTCAIVGIVAGSITKILATNARERSRREIAAYIAEGSMTPEQGERLIAADVDADRRRA